MLDNGDKDDNTGSPQEPEKKPWTRKEMEETEPMPIPSIDDDDDDNGDDGPGKK